MTIQPARHECHACCSQQAEKPGIQSVVGNTHDTHVEQVVSFQKTSGARNSHGTVPPKTGNTSVIAERSFPPPVSYTHLTLPTNREV